MKDKLIELTDKFNERNLRERLLISLGVLALIYLVCDFAIFQSIEKEKKALNARLDGIESDMTTLSAQEDVLVKALSNDPLAAKRREIMRLERELNVLDQDLEALSVGLVSAKKLTQILHDVLDATQSLEFVGMKTLEPSKLELARAEIKPEADEDEGSLEVVESVGIFKHSVVVEIRGNYFDIVDYLNRLESLEWRFYWQEIDYSVDKYPKANAVIEVYTLSTEKGAIGA